MIDVSGREALNESAILGALDTNTVRLELELGLELPKGTVDGSLPLFQRIFHEMFILFGEEKEVADNGTMPSINALEFADGLHARWHQVQLWSKSGGTASLQQVFFKDTGSLEPKPEFVEAKYRHDIEMDGDLQFSVGDRLRVIDTDPSGWWQGQNVRTGMVGEFPSNFATPLTRAEIEDQRQQWKPLFDAIDADGNGSLTRDEIVTSLKIEPEGRRQLERSLGLPSNTMENVPKCFHRIFNEIDADQNGNISFYEFSDYFQRRFIQLKLKKVVSKKGKLRKGKRYRLARIFFDGEDVAEDDPHDERVDDNDTGDSDDEERPPNPGYVVAYHDHEAELHDDLEFVKGDRIRVVETDKSGWWQGECLRTGAMGEFPSNFCSPAPAEAYSGATDVDGVEMASLHRGGEQHEEAPYHLVTPANEENGDTGAEEEADEKPWGKETEQVGDSADAPYHDVTRAGEGGDDAGAEEAEENESKCG